MKTLIQYEVKPTGVWVWKNNEKVIFLPKSFVRKMARVAKVFGDD